MLAHSVDTIVKGILAAVFTDGADTAFIWIYEYNRFDVALFIITRNTACIICINRIYEG